MSIVRKSIRGIALLALVGLVVFGRPGETTMARDGRRSFVIIPNVDDDNGDGAADAAGTVIDPQKDDDLLQINIRPSSPLPPRAVLRIDVPAPWDRLVRVFVRNSSGVFGRADRPLEVAADETNRDGITIAIDTGDFADEGRPPAFDVRTRFETADGRALSEETIECRVAPFLMSSCLDQAEAVHVAKTPGTEQFVRDLAPLVREAGATLRAFADPALPEHDIWMQDAAEIGYASDGRRSMHVTLRGNRGRKLDDLFAGSLLGKDSGVIRRGEYRGEQAEWIDWYGNLEVSPPVTAGGRTYPNGRIYAGTQGVRAMHPDVIRFLEAQRSQAPVLWLDTSWLVIGHVDETVSWVPSTVGTPYRMLVPSPRLAVEILRKAAADAPHCMLNRGTTRHDGRPGDSPEREVTAALNDKTLMAAQEYVQKKIDGVRRALQEGLGIADADIVEIPVLFSTTADRFAGRYGAETPNMVNGLQVGRTTIVPDPHGPLVNGKDVLLQAVKDRLEPLGCRVVAIDDFYPYHWWGGETHCGTNATRRPPATR